MTIYNVFRRCTIDAELDRSDDNCDELEPKAMKVSGAGHFKEMKVAKGKYWGTDNGSSYALELCKDLQRLECMIDHSEPWSGEDSNDDGTMKHRLACMQMQSG
jgi:hypothetical protein